MQNIHPYFVHFPVAILSIGLLWDLLGIVTKKDSFLHAGWWAQMFGTLAIVASVITGLIAESAVVHNDAVHGIMETHKAIGLVAAGVFIALFIWRSILRSALPVKKILLVVYILLSTGSVVTMLTGAHLGGRMVYEFGVGGNAVPQVGSSEHHHSEEGTPSNPDHEDEHKDHEENEHKH